jgi:hypothetical protein
MRCQRCGSEIGPMEAFCGQCGNPTTSLPSPTEMVSGPLPRVGLTGAHRTTNPLSNPGIPETPTLGAQRPGSTQNTRVPPSPVAQQVNSQYLRTSPPNQRTDFYQDATEAINLPPAGIGQGYAPGYQQPVPPGASMPGFYAGPGLYGSPAQTPQMGNYASPRSTPFSGQNYNYGQPGRYGLSQHKRGSGAFVLIAFICLFILLIGIFGIIALYVKDQQNNASTQTNATTTSSPAAKATPSLTPTAAPTLTPTAMPSPSPTLAPTPAADAGFLWCSSACTAYGFTTEYPQTWQMGATSDTAGILFTNPAQPDQYAALKAPGSTSSAAGDLLVSDLQTNFASKPGYVPPASNSTATIGGETWVTAVAYYQGNTQQQERVTVYVTVHQGKAYIIELQAANAQFDAINTQFFASMLGRYQFVQTPTQ